MKRLKGLFRRVFALFFCVWIFIASSVVPFASAFVETLAVQQGIELLLTILIGVGGATFRNEIDARAVAEIAWNTLEKSGSPALSTLLDRAKWLNDHPEQAQNAGFRVSADLWNEIKGTLTGFFADGQYVVDGVTHTIEANPTAAAQEAFVAYFEEGNIDVFSFVSRDFSGYYDISRNGNLLTGTCHFADGTLKTAQIEYRTGRIYKFRVICSNNSCGFYIGSYNSDGSWAGQSFINNLAYPISLASGISFTSANDLAYPGDDFLVKAPDLPSVDLDGNITYPPLDLSPDAYAVPYPVYPGTGDKIESIPFDVPVDVGTGESLDKDIPDNPDVPDTPDIPILGDILGLLKQILDALISLLQGIWDAIKGLAQSIIDGIAGIFSWLKGLLQSILDALTGFFDSPSNFRLNFDAFKNVVLTDRFPWSIPWDFVNSIKVFAATASDYQLRIDLDTAYFQIHENIDLTPFALPIAFFRYGATVWFAIGLILRTRSLIKW